MEDVVNNDLMRDKYICKECSKEALDINGKIVRSCEHTGTIILELNVIVTGEGNMC
jgi:hypothetical protein